MIDQFPTAWFRRTLYPIIRLRRKPHLGSLLATASVPSRTVPIHEFLLTGKLPFRAAGQPPSWHEQAAIQAEVAAVLQRIKRQFLFAPTAAMLLGLGNFGVPLASLIGLPLVLYATIPYWHLAAIQLLKQHQIGLRVVAPTLIVGMLAFGHVLTLAIFLSMTDVSNILLLHTYRSTQSHLTALLADLPPMVWVRTDTGERQLPLAEVTIGMVVVVHAGEMIAIDGTIVAGTASTDQRALTGEAQPVEKTLGDWAFAGTLVLTGSIDIRAEQAGDQTMLARIGQVLTNTIDYTTTLELKGRQLAERSVMPTLLLSVGSFPFVGMQSALAVLFSYFGGAMSSLAPLSVLTFLKIASTQGILVKDGRALETLQEVDTVVFDKTGTLTEEHPHVARVHPCADLTAEQVLHLAAAAEHKQSHPIAYALHDATNEVNLPIPEEVAYDIGFGLTVQLDGQQVRVGSSRFMDTAAITIPPDIAALQFECHAYGHTLVYVAVDDTLVGAIELHATTRPEAASIIADLHARGLHVAVISGDHIEPTRHLAQQLNIDTYYAEVLPADKSRLVTLLQTEGRKVCFVGDGVNDAIALKQAHVSVSLRGATTIATDTAEVIMMEDNLRQLTTLFALADQLERTMHTNLLYSFMPGVLVLGSVYIFHIGLVPAGIIYFGGLWIGMGNAALPGVQYYMHSRRGR